MLLKQHHYFYPHEIQSRKCLIRDLSTSTSWQYQHQQMMDAPRFQYSLTFLLLHLVINSKTEHKTWPTSSVLQFSFTASSDSQKSTLQGLHQHRNQRGEMNIIHNSQQSKLNFSPWEKNILAHTALDNHLCKCVARECSCLNSYQNQEIEYIK